MGRKISDADRIMDFALNASEEVLDNTISTLLSVKRNKYPTKVERAPQRRPARKRPANKQPAADTSNSSDEQALAAGN